VAEKEVPQLRKSGTTLQARTPSCWRVVLCPRQNATRIVTRRKSCSARAEEGAQGPLGLVEDGPLPASPLGLRANLSASSSYRWV